jgi:hypothetical protein
MYLVPVTSNKKVGDISVTYLPIKQTCPNTCALKDKGCYAQSGNVNFQVIRLEKASNYKAYDIVRKEAREIIAYAKKNYKHKPLRLHVSGDARTNKSVKLLALAAKSWNNKVYSYTHAWRTVDRGSWGDVSILASVESIADAKEALTRGYAPAIVVASHFGSKAYVKDGVKIIPCPQQTVGVTCEKCKLCMNDKVLKDQNAAIAFAVHGVTKKRALTVIK